MPQNDAQLGPVWAHGRFTKDCKASASPAAVMRCPVVQSHCSALFMTFREGNGKKKEYGAAGEYRVGLLGATCAQSGRSERQPIHPAHVSDTTAVAAPRPSPQPQPSLPQPPAGSASFRSQRDAAPIVPGTSYDVCRPQCEEEALALGPL
mmetsp:Transcript_110202/g.187716  ORF Transcript_110202/g.187716 Transcript_110202/m.187716 type:complete len:150 (-) Transcript_110202:664-1113(-)|eukprot:CAMPEP_0174282390 /NCGR_PEP_ID=MMETSP0809-20121228/2903_1 /TAXON_ID=73025 ORGANISM="Eutreptiella gymnastica-like, Strain CCMP1594" /NCGR_SAMPLE_ID=MMETSP0809 /ASSEMBLY_ACC=CAM_ASM_000658 /LENGTH=149 /DNA_ID=CAMNT_0015376565 /DNA_START=196 /DNA_END=645 /DNA_ORIENTATION=+